VNRGQRHVGGIRRSDRNPPTQAEMRAVANKLDELILALRR
jgi:hypothetical protein